MAIKCACFQRSSVLLLDAAPPGAPQRRFREGVNGLQTDRQNNKRGGRGRLSALLVIVSLLLLPFGQLAFGLTAPAEAALPACCRAHGQHQCAMRRLVRSSAETPSPQVAQVIEKCPCSAGVAPAAHGKPLRDFRRGFEEFHPCAVWGCAAAYGGEHASSPERGNRKRGPPASGKYA